MKLTATILLLISATSAIRINQSETNMLNLQVEGYVVGTNTYYDRAIKIMKQIDKDGSNTITPEELTSYYTASYGTPLPAGYQSQIDRTFKMADANGNNHIDLDELAVAMGYTGPALDGSSNSTTGSNSTDTTGPSSEHYEEAKKMMNEIDCDNDNQITLEELTEYYESKMGGTLPADKRAELASQFANADTNGDGAVDLQELTQAIGGNDEDSEGEASDDDARFHQVADKILEEFDTNKDGFIIWSEIRKVMYAEHQKETDPLRTKAKTQYKAYRNAYRAYRKTQTQKRTVSREFYKNYRQARKVFRQTDTDNDRKVTRDEIVAMLKTMDANSTTAAE